MMEIDRPNGFEFKRVHTTLAYYLGYQSISRDKLNYVRKIGDDQYPRFHILQREVGDRTLIYFHIDIEKHVTVSFAKEDLAKQRFMELKRLICLLEKSPSKHIRFLRDELRQTALFELAERLEAYEKWSSRSVDEEFYTVRRQDKKLKVKREKYLQKKYHPALDLGEINLD